jgi:hypothetical protein
LTRPFLSEALFSKVDPKDFSNSLILFSKSSSRLRHLYSEKAADTDTTASVKAKAAVVEPWERPDVAIDELFAATASGTLRRRRECIGPGVKSVFTFSYGRDSYNNCKAHIIIKCLKVQQRPTEFVGFAYILCSVSKY